MKPRNILRNFALMSVVALLLVLILTPAHARDVPFAAKHTVDGNFGEASDVTTADVDGDGDLDILGAGRTANEIAWWENVNQGSEVGDGSTWRKHSVDNGFDGARSVAAADVDGDGDLDILGGRVATPDLTHNTYEIAWWENDGTPGEGAWSKKSVDLNDVEVDYDTIVVAAADVDGDGDMDILNLLDGESAIYWWENLMGDGSGWQKGTVTTDFLGVYDVAVADMDKDGDLDVLGGLV